jgi:hypothetical protein
VLLKSPVKIKIFVRDALCIFDGIIRRELPALIISRRFLFFHDKSFKSRRATRHEPPWLNFMRRDVKYLYAYHGAEIFRQTNTRNPVMKSAIFPPANAPGRVPM